MNDHVFKALADPTRREILRLVSGGERTAGDLAARFDMTRPSMSHHFAILKQADLIVCRRAGQQLHYSLNTTVAQDVLAWLWELFNVGRTSTLPPSWQFDSRPADQSPP